jgi:hypothetical protein
MADHQDIQVHPKTKPLRFENGRMYINRDAERKFYFFLTVVILVAGLLYKLGIL